MFTDAVLCGVQWTEECSEVAAAIIGRVYFPLNPGIKHLGSARASDVPLLGRTVTVVSEGDESFIINYGFFKYHLTVE